MEDEIWILEDNGLLLEPLEGCHCDGAIPTDWTHSLLSPALTGPVMRE
jgi:hypothetical protein